jgi:hypothetical protein
MFIVLTPYDVEGKECDDMAFNSDLILNIRSGEQRTILKFLNGDEVKVKQKRKEIVQRINRSSEG